MKIAFLHPFLYRYPRGIERYTINLGTALVRQDTAVDILTWRWPEPLSWSELEPRVTVRTFPTSRYYAANLVVPFYVLALMRNRYDMLYIHFADYGEAPALRLLRQFRRRPRGPRCH